MDQRNLCQFLSLDKTEADLARILRERIWGTVWIDNQWWLLCVSGDLSSRKGTDIDFLANREEADQRLIMYSLHAVKSDVLVILIHVFGKAREVWMIVRTSANRNCYPVRIIADMFPECITTNLVGIHALTDKLIRSLHLTEKENKLLKKTFVTEPSLLKGIGKDSGFTDTENISVTYVFIWRLLRQSSHVSQFMIAQTTLDVVLRTWMIWKLSLPPHQKCILNSWRVTLLLREVKRDLIIFLLTRMNKTCKLNN